MREERVSSAIRLELRPGEWVLWQTGPFRFISLHGSAARIRDTVTTELREVPVADLRGMPTLPSEEFDRRLDRLRTTADSGWSLGSKLFSRALACSM
jgi:hypothetical protein